MPPIEQPPNETKKSLQERLRLHNQVRRDLEAYNSLSTITEEPNSSRTMTSSDTKAVYSDDTLSDVFIESLTQESTLPTPREPPPPRKKRHTSVVVKGAPQQVIIPHEDKCVRTPAMKQELLDHIGSSGKPLFETVTGDGSKEPVPSILVTGFGLRNLASLQRALQLEEEQKLLQQVYRTDEELSPISSSAPSLKSSSTSSSKSVEITVHESESDTSETQTEPPYQPDDVKEQRLNYLMGLEADEEYQESKEEEVEVQTEREVPLGKSVLMRRAQKYLREHKIFEFFQYIIAHLLSALPDNPIEFIIDLLDQCMIFRSGITKPPLLYERKHLESLFNLMDKMRTGYIELDQYKTGMRTVGICSFNPNPQVTSEGMVSKDTFIEEAHDCLIEILTDLLKRRWIETPPPRQSDTYLKTPQLSIISSLNQNPGTPIMKTKCIIR
ncbi:hypothetical protein RI129_008456 [Pyrocoelia pectoralis]|uniref:EF-hand domain-containing protein n=1 Tax=Pyrocoelia pectoralis TaxID=417401 RepID=A0AAN7VFA4_9COLE